MNSERRSIRCLMGDREGYQLSRRFGRGFHRPIPNKLRTERVFRGAGDFPDELDGNSLAEMTEASNR